MKQTWKGAVVATAGVLAISGGIVAGAVLPAAASPAFNEAYATQAFGLINSAPTAVAQYPGSSPVTLPFSAIPALLLTGPSMTRRAGSVRRRSSPACWQLASARWT